MKSLLEHSTVLLSTGVTWDEDSLARRYGFVRRIRDEVRFELIYCPYWLFELHGQAHWRLFGARSLAMLVASDARSGRCLRVSAPPVLVTERLLPASAVFCESGPFLPARLKGPHVPEKDVRAHVVRPLCDRKTGQSNAEAFALAAWRRRCNLPLGPRADILCASNAATLLHKPFWIMTSLSPAASGRNKLFIFDASTGLGGVSDYWNVVEYVLSLNAGSAEQCPEPQAVRLDLSA